MKHYHDFSVQDLQFKISHIDNSSKQISKSEYLKLHIYFFQHKKRDVTTPANPNAPCWREPWTPKPQSQYGNNACDEGTEIMRTGLGAYGTCRGFES